MSAVIGILAALVGRERGGDGASIDVSMHEAALYWLMVPAARELVEGGDAAGAGLPTFGDHACYNVYRTKDGEHVALGALEPKFWLAFCAAAGRDDLAARHLSDAADQRALIADVRAIFASQHARRVARAPRSARSLPHARQPAARGFCRSARGRARRRDGRAGASRRASAVRGARARSGAGARAGRSDTRDPAAPHLSLPGRLKPAPPSAFRSEAARTRRRSARTRAPSRRCGRWQRPRSSVHRDWVSIGIP